MRRKHWGSSCKHTLTLLTFNKFLSAMAELQSPGQYIFPPDFSIQHQRPSSHEGS